MSRSLFAPLAAVAVLSCASAAQATIFTFTANMLGTSENPQNASPATGFTEVLFDTVANTMQVDVTWGGLIGGNPGAAHIHCCIAQGSNVGVAVGFPGFPSTLSGSYSHVFDLLDATIYTTGFRNNFGGGTAAGSEQALLDGLLAGHAYSNIHNATFSGGEIRGLLTAVPEPAAWGLMLLGFGAIGAGLRRRRAAAALA